MANLPLKCASALVAASVSLAAPLSPLAAQQDSPQTAPAPPAPSESAVAIAREIIDLGMPEKNREAIFSATMEQMMAQIREAQQKASPIEDPQVVAILDQRLAEFKLQAMEKLRFHLPSIMEGWALAYANIFTPRELSDIRDFVATPSGQRFFELGAAVTAEPNFAAANQRYMNDVMALLPALQEQLRADMLEYLSSLEGADTAS